MGSPWSVSFCDTLQRTGSKACLFLQPELFYVLS